MSKPHPKGKEGEELAARYLSGKGYEVKERNARFQGGEIDIIAHDPVNNELVFVEVKSRSSHLFGWPEESVRREKRQHLRRASELYLAGHREYIGKPYRFDIVALEMDRAKGTANIVHYKNIEIGAEGA